MLLSLILACTLGYNYDHEGASLSFEQTAATHYFYYDKAIKSSVRILCFSGEEEAGHASGNYFKIGQHRFIITAAHVVTDGQKLYVEDYKDKVELEVILIDTGNDIAFAVPKKKLKSTKAINYRTNKKLNIMGETMVYAGFPADLNKSVFHGTVSTEARYSFIMQSFALPGSSGSVVFDSKGLVVGVLSAIKVGYSGISPWPQLHGSLVYVNRLSFYDKYMLEELLVKWKNSK
jgi:S1-C subfamily serine protease|tara:strand:+ start:118 stop:816 length:699 start_codon:yes stop_codon:yes gene_type:complete